MATPFVYDPTREDFAASARAIYRVLRDEHPLYRNEERGTWALSRYADLRDAYYSLQDHNVDISHCTDHISQRSIYFADPDGNRLEIYYEVPDALERYKDTPRGDEDVSLDVTKPGEPLPGWLEEDWPPQ